MIIKSLFSDPKIVCIVGNVNEAKSNLLYYLLDRLSNTGEFTLYTYGLRSKIRKAIEVFSVDELEEVTDSVVILDEVMTLWDLDNRNCKKQIEKTLRLIHHHNNILIICALPENLKKFICGKINEWIFKRCTLADFINGSKALRICKNYKGVELGSAILNISKGKALYFNGTHYYKLNIPYLKKFDSKKTNEKIIKKYKRQENVRKTSGKRQENVRK